MKTKPEALFLVVLCTLCTSFAVILNKIGATKLEMTLQGTIFNIWLLSGLFLLGIAAVLLMMSLKGGDVSVIYPVVATSYIWATLLSSIFFGEEINLFKILGIFFIVVGIVTINLGQKKEFIEFFDIKEKKVDR